MNQLNIETIARIINSSIVTVPGVAGFSDANSNGQILEQQDDFAKAVRIEEEDNLYILSLFLVFLEGINIKDVAKEVQIRVKYELEKHDYFNSEFIVKVYVKDLLK